MKQLVFVLTNEHLQLIQRLNIRSHSSKDKKHFPYPVPAVDLYRPFGNSAVLYDVAEIAGIEPRGEMSDDVQLLSDEQKEQLKQLIAEIPTALQICTSTLSFQTGVYTRRGEWDDWQLIEDKDLASRLRQQLAQQLKGVRA